MSEGLNTTTTTTTANHASLPVVSNRKQDRSTSEATVGGSKSNPPSKKQRKQQERVKVLTFQLSHSPVVIEILSSQSLYHLVDFICQVSAVGGSGQSEGADDHLWNIRVPGFGKIEKCLPPSSFLDLDDDDDDDGEERLYPRPATRVKLGELGLSAANTQLQWEYDYGSTMNYTITFLGTSDLTPDESLEQFPRRKTSSSSSDPIGYQKFVVPEESGVNLNQYFASLNEWAFKNGPSDSVCFFKAGRKQNHGIIYNHERCSMIYLPAETPKKLEEYLVCFDFGSKFRRQTCNWKSMIVLHKLTLSPKLVQKWGRNLEEGFCEMKTVPSVAARKEHAPPPLNDVFPKTAALAGFRKDSKVKRGWITYKDSVLRICSGQARPNNSIKGCLQSTAFVGMDQHEPVSSQNVLFTKNIRLESLHDLLCVVEGLLRTL